MRRAAVALLFLVAGCLTGPSPTTTVRNHTTTTLPPTSAPAPVVTTTPLSTCLQGDPPFLPSGEIPVRLPEGQPDAARISDVRVQSEQGCDRVAISLATEGGAPARVAGDVQATITSSPGIVRAVLDPSITATSVFDRLFELPRAHAVYVVRSLEQRLYVDVHLAGPAEARVFVDRSPAVLTVDLRGGASLGGVRAVSGDLVVLLSEASGLAYPLQVGGYAVGRGMVTAVVRSADEVSESWQAVSAEGADTWTEFSISIPDGPRGRVTLEVTGPSGSVLEVSLEIS